MHFRSLFLLATLPFSLPAQIPTGDPEAPLGLTSDEASQFLHKVELIQSEFGSQKKSLSESALSRFRTSAASEGAAVEFYLACFKVVNIDRQPVVPGEKAPDPDDTKWRAPILDAMRDTATPAALRLQCAYLALTLEAAAAEDKATIIPKLREYLKQAMAETAAHAEAESEDESKGRKGAKGRTPRSGQRGTGELHNVLQTSVQETLFAKAYNLANYVDKLEPWSYSPLDLEAQYGKVILPHFASNDRAQLPVIWDEFISQSTTLRKAAMGDAGFLMWGQTGYKTLLWRKWTALLKNGINGNLAANELVAMVHANPTHPDIRTWVEDLSKLAAVITDEPAPGK